MTELMNLGASPATTGPASIPTSGGHRRANLDHAPSYGADPTTTRAIRLFQDHFGADAEVFFAFNGTGANVVGLQSLLRPFEAVICAEIRPHLCRRVRRSRAVPRQQAHPRPHAGRKADPRPGRACGRRRRRRTPRPAQGGVDHPVHRGRHLLPRRGDRRPRRLGPRARHVPSSRRGPALQCGRLPRRRPGRVRLGAGVDVLSFGGTKNGAMGAEAVVSFRPQNRDSLRYIRKQSMQLASKMRFVSAQFVALLSDDLWRTNAVHANRMAEDSPRDLRGRRRHSCLSGGGQRRVRRPARGRDRGPPAAHSVLRLGRGHRGRALDVLVRHDRRGRRRPGCDVVAGRRDAAAER